MSCAACSARVEKAVLGVSGVAYCAVNLLTASMSVEGTADSSEIIRAVEAAGYGATVSTEKISASGGKSPENKETSPIIKRLVASVILLVVLMYISMGHTMWNAPLPEFISGNPMIIGILQMLLSATVMAINCRFFISGARGVLHGAPNMDTLVSLGSLSAFGYSFYALICMSSAISVGNFALATEYLHDLYFESAAMILTLITVGKMLEARAKGKTTDALAGLMKLAPKTATLIRSGAEVTVPIDEVKVGDIFIVRPGEQVPTDGVVVEGASAVNESALTGESIPVDKLAGSSVASGTLNESGVLTCEATRVGEDTTLSQIIKMVSDASASKAPIAKLADKVSGIFAPTVIFVALVTLAVWLCRSTCGIGPGTQLSLCFRSCDTRSDHGRHWRWCEERHTLQNCRIA